MQVDPNCIFCKIVAGVEPAEIVRNNDDAIVIKSKFPAADIHLLIIPKKHIQSIAHASRADLEIVGELNLLAAEVAAEQGTKDYKLIFNVGKYAHVPHLHLHLLAGDIEQDKT